MKKKHILEQTGKNIKKAFSDKPTPIKKAVKDLKVAYEAGRKSNSPFQGRMR